MARFSLSGWINHKRNLSRGSRLVSRTPSQLASFGKTCLSALSRRCSVPNDCCAVIHCRRSLGPNVVSQVDVEISVRLTKMLTSQPLSQRFLVMVTVGASLYYARAPERSFATFHLRCRTENDLPEVIRPGSGWLAYYGPCKFLKLSLFSQCQSFSTRGLLRIRRAP